MASHSDCFISCGSPLSLCVCVCVCVRIVYTRFHFVGKLTTFLLPFLFWSYYLSNFFIYIFMHNLLESLDFLMIYFLFLLLSDSLYTKNKLRTFCFIIFRFSLLFSFSSPFYTVSSNKKHKNKKRDLHIANFFIMSIFQGKVKRDCSIFQSTMFSSLNKLFFSMTISI